MSDQTSATSFVTLKEFGDYLRRNGVDEREISREKGVLMSHFKSGLRRSHFKPVIRCTVCGLNWYQCPHRSLDSPEFERDGLARAVDDHFGERPTQAQGIGDVTELRVRGWLGLSNRCA